MKFTQTAGLFVLACAVCAPAAATEVINLDYARSKFDYSDIDAAYGYRGSFEHWFDTVPLSLAIGYSDSGKADITSLFNATASFSGADLVADFSIPLNAIGARSRLFIGGGAYYGTFKAGSGSGTASEHNTGGTLNAGIDWMFSRHVGARIGYQTFLSVKDFSENKSLGVVQAGLLIAWGGAPAASVHASPERTPDPQSASASAPAPVVDQTDAAPVAEPAPVRSLAVAQAEPAAPPPPPVAPPAPVAPGLIVGAQAKLRDGTSGRNRPTADSNALPGLEFGTRVTLKAWTENAAGAWWYVSGPTVTGWVRAQDLEPQP